MFANIQFSILHTRGCSHGAATQDTCTIQPPPQTTLLCSQHTVSWHSDKLVSYIFEEIIIPPHPHPSHPSRSSKSRTVYYKPVQILRSFETVVRLILGLAKFLYLVIIYARRFWQSSGFVYRFQFNWQNVATINEFPISDNWLLVVILQVVLAASDKRKFEPGTSRIQPESAASTPIRSLFKRLNIDFPANLSPATGRCTVT